GHSFGAKVVLASVTERPLPRAVDTVVLLQPAISFWAMANEVPGSGQPGGYRLARDTSRVKGPIVLTFSKYDEPLNRFYPLASRVAGQVGEQFEAVAEPSKYSALGAVGAYGSDSWLVTMKKAGE